MLFIVQCNFEVKGACPDQWTSLAGGCYKFLPEKLSWEDAKEACSSSLKAGWLIEEIDSEEQNDAIHAEALNQDSPTAWIGLGERATEEEFVWGSGETPSYTNWAQGQPKNNKSKAQHKGWGKGFTKGME